MFVHEGELLESTSLQMRPLNPCLFGNMKRRKLQYNYQLSTGTRSSAF